MTENSEIGGKKGNANGVSPHLVYKDIEIRRGGTPFVAVASVEFTYYLNPIKLDRNLEWNEQNLCKEPIYPRPEKRRRQKYESFNRNQKP